MNGNYVTLHTHWHQWVKNSVLMLDTYFFNSIFNSIMKKLFFFLHIHHFIFQVLFWHWFHLEKKIRDKLLLSPFIKRIKMIQCEYRNKLNKSICTTLYFFYKDNTYSMYGFPFLGEISTSKYYIPYYCNIAFKFYLLLKNENNQNATLTRWCHETVIPIPSVCP